MALVTSVEMPLAYAARSVAEVLRAAECGQVDWVSTVEDRGVVGADAVGRGHDGAAARTLLDGVIDVTPPDNTEYEAWIASRTG